MAPPESPLNEHQRRRLVATCRFVDEALVDLERAFTEAAGESPFCRYTNDLTDAERQLVADYFSRIRSCFVSALEMQGLSPAPPRIGIRHALSTQLLFVDDAIEELRPRYMKGYGVVAKAAEALLDDLVEDLHRIIREFTTSLDR